MRYLAIDYGLKRTGLALCDLSETIVSPLCCLTMDRSKPKRLTDRLRQIVSENEIEAVVVGLPLNMDDSEGAQAKLVRVFGAELEKTLGLPVHLQDERLSSSAADEMMIDSGLTAKKRRDKRDMLAACDILREFLDKHLNGKTQLL
ncbi:MAG: Holliday junction resolvase RuvX [Candidatus Brocadiia bacterium]|nr:MAG: Holliday junction resolvase RuvX [Candidatus Brocadiia bacterium]